MDVTFRSPQARFNLRAAAVILHEGKILAMMDDNSPYYYLPGGRIQLHETAEAAVLREVREELAIEARIVRPLWLNQGFFNEDVIHEDFHEICVYFLMDVSGTELLARGESFLQQEGRRTHRFSWLPIDQLQDFYFYPLFLKERILDLPRELTCLVSAENARPALGPDLSFATEEGEFSLRVCGVFFRDGKLLTMENEGLPGFHLPGGRVALHEDFEAALHREIQEELGVDASIARHLWFDQRFYTNPVTGAPHHELCLYSLMDVPAALIASAHTNVSRWLSQTEMQHVFPSWVAPQLSQLPDELRMLSHHE